MSDIIRDRAVVLKTFDYGESSIVAVALTRSHGKVRFLAKGARRFRSPMHGVLRTGNACEAVFYFRPDRGLQLLKECDGGGPNGGAGQDLERLCLFQAGLEIVDCAVVERDADEKLFDLVERYMRLLPAARDPWALFYALEIGVLALAGSLPSVDACGRCGTALAGERFAVDPASGIVVCPACCSGERRALSQASCTLFALLAREGFPAARSASLRRDERREIGELIHRLFANHIEGYRLPNALRLFKEVNGQ